MQVSIEHTGDLECRMTVEVPEEQVKAEVQSRLSSLSKHTRVDGFRPGKVPVKVIERRYGGQVRFEVIEHLMQSSFREALLAENLAVAGRARIEPAQNTPGEGLCYTATFEIYPEVKLGDLEKLEVTRPVTEITEIDVDAVIERLRHENRDWVPVDRTASEGDRVNLDFVGFVDDKPMEGGQAHGFEVLIGSSTLLDGFGDGLKGHGVSDEFDLELRFPEKYPKPELAGRPVRFSIKVNQILEGKLPELETAFFAKLGMDESSLEAFRRKVMKTMEKERDSAIRNRTKQNVLQALLRANPVELPQGLLSEECRRLAEQRKKNLLAQGWPKEQLSGLESCAQEAKQRLTLGLILIEIVRQNGLQADPVKVRQRVEAIAASYRHPHPVIKWYYEDENHLTEVKNAVLEDDAVACTLSKARVREVPLPFDALMNPVHTEHLTQ